mmetsp:Transcript_14662/g.21368  ORF Transcript_14662/g.21368 Transcript_14662/m.21368 type:complete len:225 (+) Transcript_14662:52-726(+)
MISSVVDNLASVNSRIQSILSGRTVRLVAVSKTKPEELIQQAYDAGHRHFGENYVEEIVRKAPNLPADIQWHMIGHLQSNKVKKLLEVPNLYVLETLDSKSLADKLEKQAASVRENPLKVFLQVNTSGEQSKSGVVGEHVDLGVHVARNCPHLELAGLMTIGARGNSGDFTRLIEVRQELSQALNRDPESLELSMGMSGDFEEAIAYGSTNVRVGSLIFGERSK